MNKNIGEIISSLRKEKGMTQNDLAQKLNVTDKAVSKWERNLSCPDINSIPKLAEVLEVSVEELLDAAKHNEEKENETNNILNIALPAVGLAMGVCVIVTSALNAIETKSAITLLAVGVTAFGIYILRNNKEK